MKLMIKSIVVGMILGAGVFALASDADRNEMQPQPISEGANLDAQSAIGGSGNFACTTCRSDLQNNTTQSAISAYNQLMQVSGAVGTDGVK